MRTVLLLSFPPHTAEISSVVLEGELHVTDIDNETGKELGTRVRVAGDFVHKEPGDVHMEQGGPAGALVLFPFTLLTAKANSLNR